MIVLSLFKSHVHTFKSSAKLNQAQPMYFPLAVILFLSLLRKKKKKNKKKENTILLSYSEMSAYIMLLK